MVSVNHFGFPSHHTKKMYTGTPAKVIKNPMANSIAAERIEEMTIKRAQNVNRTGSTRGTWKEIGKIVFKKYGTKYKNDTHSANCTVLRGAWISIYSQMLLKLGVMFL